MLCLMHLPSFTSYHQVDLKLASRFKVLFNW